MKTFLNKIFNKLFSKILRKKIKKENNLINQKNELNINQINDKIDNSYIIANGFTKASNFDTIKFKSSIKK